METVHRIKNAVKVNNLTMKWRRKRDQRQIMVTEGDEPQVPQGDAGATDNESPSHLLELNRCVIFGYWEPVNHVLTQHEDAMTARISWNGGTALHQAVSAKNADIAKELTKLMSEEDLEIQDNTGDTALGIAAATGSFKLVKRMVKKNKNLVTMENKKGALPLEIACWTNHKDVARYLYSMTPRKLLFQDNGKYGSKVLGGFVAGRLFDMALNLLYNSPNSDAALDVIKNSNLLEDLSSLPEAFLSGNRFGFWERWIYQCIKIQPFIRSRSVRINISDRRERESISNNIVLDQLRNFAANHLDFLGIKKIYNLKLRQIRLLELVDCVCGYLSNSDVKACQEMGVIQAFNNAAKFGIIEFVLMILYVSPDIHHMARDEDGRDLIMSAVAHRHEKIFGFLSSSFGGRKEDIDSISGKDNFGNTPLHLAGMLSPSSKLQHIPGAALRVQRELQWYEHVKNHLDSKLFKKLNKDHKTARKLFAEAHGDLIAKGEEWMKATATSCSVVGALIITIMFTAIFTVPGGYNQDTGLPISLNSNSFKIFIISDTVSLFSSSTSALMFLGILTSRFAEQDFLKSLPTKLIIGLSTLFLSIATMMLAFAASLVIILDGNMKLVVPIVSLAAIPIILFLFLQVPLLVDVLKSTYGSSIFTFRLEDYKDTLQLIEKRITKGREARA